MNNTDVVLSTLSEEEKDMIIKVINKALALACKKLMMTEENQNINKLFACEIREKLIKEAKDSLGIRCDNIV